MTWHPIPSEFSYIYGKFSFFYQCAFSPPPPILISPSGPRPENLTINALYLFTSILTNLNSIYFPLPSIAVYKTCNSSLLSSFDITGTVAHYILNRMQSKYTKQFLFWFKASKEHNRWSLSKIRLLTYSPNKFHFCAFSPYRP